MYFVCFFFACLVFLIFIYLFFVFLSISAICRGCRGIFLEMDSQEETVSIQRFEIGIHKDLPIKETINFYYYYYYFFWGGELRSTFEGFFFLFLFLTVFLLPKNRG